MTPLLSNIDELPRDGNPSHRVTLVWELEFGRSELVELVWLVGWVVLPGGSSARAMLRESMKQVSD